MGTVLMEGLRGLVSPSTEGDKAEASPASRPPPATEPAPSRLSVRLAAKRAQRKEQQRLQQAAQQQGKQSAVVAARAIPRISGTSSGKPSQAQQDKGAGIGLVAPSEDDLAFRVTLEQECGNIEELIGKATATSMPPAVITALFESLEAKRAELEVVNTRIDTVVQLDTPEQPSKQPSQQQQQQRGKGKKGASPAKEKSARGSGASNEASPEPRPQEELSAIGLLLAERKVLDAPILSQTLLQLGVQDVANLEGYDDLVDDVVERLPALPKASRKALERLVKEANPVAQLSVESGGGKGGSANTSASGPSAAKANAKGKTKAGSAQAGSFGGQAPDELASRGWSRVEPAEELAAPEEEISIESGLPAFTDALSLVPELMEMLKPEELEGSMPEDLVRTGLKIFKVDSIEAVIETEAAQLDSILAIAASRGAKLPNAKHVGRAAAVKNLLELKRSFDEAAKPSSTEPGTSKLQGHVDVSAIAAAAAAGAIAGVGNGDSKESGDAAKNLAEARAQDRVRAVARNAGSVAALEALEQMVHKCGELSEGSSEAEGKAQAIKFLEAHKQAERDDPALANLLHTHKIPTVSGMLASASELGEGWTGSEGSARAETRVIKAARLVQDYIPTAIAEAYLDDACDNATKLVATAFFGNLFKTGASSTTFKLSDAVDSSFHSMVAGKSSEAAKDLIDNSMHAVGLAHHHAHPRDSSIFQVMAELKRASIGAKGDAAMHNTVLGLFFSAYAKAFSSFQQSSKAMPRFEHVWEKVKSNDKYKELTSASNQQIGLLMSRIEALEKKKDSAARTTPPGKTPLQAGGSTAKLPAGTQPTATPSTTKTKEQPEPPPTTGDARPNKYQGEARVKLRLKMLEARAEMNQTQTLAKAAEEAKKDDAAQLRATANEKAAEYEALLAKLKEKKDE